MWYFEDFIDPILRGIGIKDIFEHPDSAMLAAVIGMALGAWIGKWRYRNYVLTIVPSVILIAQVAYHSGWFEKKPELTVSFRHEAPCVQSPNERSLTYSGYGATLWRIGPCLTSRGSFVVQPVLVAVYREENDEWRRLVPGVSAKLDLAKGLDHPFGPDRIGPGDIRTIVLFLYSNQTKQLSLFDDKMKPEWNVLHDIAPGNYRFIIRLDTTPNSESQSYVVTFSWFGDPKNFNLDVTNYNPIL